MPYKHLLIPLSALALACSTPPSEEDPVCGRGERVEDAQGTFVCVFSSGLLIETGFECPADVSFEIPYEDGVICSPSPTLPESLEGQIADGGWVITEPGMCMDVLCAAGETCVDGACIPRDSCQLQGCQAGEVCMGDTCEPMSMECPQGCNVSADCVNGMCVPRTCEDALEPNNSPAAAVDVSYNTPDDLGGLCSDGDVDWFKMSVQSGDVVDVTFEEILFTGMTISVYTYAERSLVPLLARRRGEPDTEPARPITFELSPTSATSDNFVIPQGVNEILIEVTGERGERSNPMRLTSVCGDLGEPDNDASFSGVRVDGAPVAGHTCTATDVDWYRIDAQPGQRLELAIDKPDLVPVEVLLYENNDGPTPGMLLEMTDTQGENWGLSMRDTGTLSLDVPPNFTSSQIYVRVRLEEPGAYDVTASWQ